MKRKTGFCFFSHLTQKPATPWPFQVHGSSRRDSPESKCLLDSGKKAEIGFWLNEAAICVSLLKTWKSKYQISPKLLCSAFNWQQMGNQMNLSALLRSYDVNCSCLFVCLPVCLFVWLFIWPFITWLSLVRIESKTGIVSNSFTFFAPTRTLLLADLVDVFGNFFVLYRNENLNGSFLTPQLSANLQMPSFKVPFFLKHHRFNITKINT